MKCLIGSHSSDPNRAPIIHGNLPNKRDDHLSNRQSEPHAHAIVLDRRAGGIGETVREREDITVGGQSQKRERKRKSNASLTIFLYL